MAWSTVEYKVQKIKFSFKDLEIQSLEREFYKSTKSLPRVSKMSPSLFGILFLDLTYAILRHPEWLETPIFSSLLVEFLQVDHGIPRSEGEKIVQTLLDTAIKLGMYNHRTICCDDREFLLYAYLCALEPQSSVPLEADLGLGLTIIQKLRAGLSVLEKNSIDSFVPEYDAMLAAIILELEHESRISPAAADLHRLRYLLLSASNDEAQPYILEEKLPDIMSQMIQIESSSQDLDPLLKKSLIHSGILAEVHEGTKRSGNIPLRLTDLGYRITALSALHARTPHPHFSDLQTLHPQWLLKRLKSGTKLEFHDAKQLILSRVQHLPADILQEIIRLLIQDYPRDLGSPFILELLTAAKNPRTKAAILLGSKSHPHSSDLADTISEMILKTDAASLKIATSQLLEGWDKP